MVIFSEGLEVFSFSIIKSLKDFRLLRTIQPVLVRKERFDAASVLKNNDIDMR